MSKERGEIIAPEGHVVLRQIDDNQYKQSDIEKQESPATGAFLTDTKQFSTGYEYKGEVIAVGPDLQHYIKIGDHVHHGIHSATVFSFNGEGLATVSKHQICAIERFPDQTENQVVTN